MAEQQQSGKPERFDAYTPEKVQQYENLWGKHFIRIDPKTKQPHESNKECFWEVIGMYPAAKFGADDNDPEMTLEVQRYWRNRKVKVGLEQNSTKQVERHEAFMDTTRDPSNGDVVPNIGAGRVQVGYSDFLKQFAPDDR